MEPMAPDTTLEPQEDLPPTESDVPEARKNLVSKWCKTVKADKEHWDKAFTRMRECRKFAMGNQWSDKPDDNRYVANITLRHIQQRVAALYAKNPRTIARVKDRLMTTVWDGSMSSVMGALEQVNMLAMMGAAMSPDMAKQMAILEEAQAVTEQRKQMEQFAKTLELLYEYNIQEQVHPFKTMMKLVVRRAVTTAVGYVKLGFQRAMQPSPEVERQIADVTQQLLTIERLATDVSKGKIDDETNSELERLRVMLASLQSQPEVVVREGLTFDYPDSCAIIPDKKCHQLREFLGCDHVTEEYVLSPEQVKEIYGKDVSDNFTRYAPNTDGVLVASQSGDTQSEDNVDPGQCIVWEVYSKADGLVYTICDGYYDFLREPAAPTVWIERFYPWFALVLNEADSPDVVYPMSDVWLMRDQQREYNRLREGLREHRKQNRPLTVSATGVLSEDDKHVLENRPGYAHIELDGLQPGQRAQDLLQPMQFSGVDPNLYEVNPIFEDVLRTVGVQEANLGGLSGGTATETSIAESARMSALQSSIDDLDDMLGQIARAAGQILLENVGPETVQKIVGPAAMWPELTREQMAEEIFLEIEAGSTGRPNQAQEIQNFERLAPIIMQIPGVKPEKFAREAIRRLDDRLRLEDMYDENLPSISALNQMMGQAQGGVQQNGGPNAPAEQGAAGAQNAPVPDQTAGAPGGPDMMPGGPPGVVQ